ncbi:hypothetical protein LINPERHAP1_LOCUS21461, partial [Linum perenne]
VWGPFYDSAMHFIYLDQGQMVWLEGSQNLKRYFGRLSGCGPIVIGGTLVSATVLSLGYDLLFLACGSISEVGGVIPDELSLCHGSEVFPIRRELEVWIPVARHGVKDSFVKSWKSKVVGFAAQKGPADETRSEVGKGDASRDVVSELTSKVSHLEIISYSYISLEKEEEEGHEDGRLRFYLEKEVQEAELEASIRTVVRIIHWN